MRNGNEALLSISPVGHGQSVKMLITLEPLIYILRLSFVYQIKLDNNRQEENNALNNLIFS